MMRREMRDGRNPYGSRGGYVVSSRRRRDRAGSDMMDYRGRGRDMNYDYAMEYEDAVGYREDPTLYRNIEREEQKFEKTGARDYEYDLGYRDMRRMDGHYPMNEGRTYYPIEAMGTFSGYYGMEEDFARGGRGRGRGRDYGYDYNYDYRRNDYAGDYGEALTKEELEDWCKKMTSQLDEREKQLLSKEAILQKAKSMAINMDGYNEMELYANTLKNYTDHKKSIGQNPDMAIKLARDDFSDEDGQYKGSEWLAVYYDTFVEE